MKNKSTSASKINEVAKQLKLKDFDIYLRNQPLKTKQGIINLDTTKGTHWVCFHNNNYSPNGERNTECYYFDSYGVQPPLEVIKSLKNGCYSTYQIQKDDSLCASYCLYILYLINSGMTYNDAVLKLFFSQLNASK